ncbi:MAG: heavy metal translocating P-type ATPase metal-binding domain-containing protein [Bacteroidota bacterium]|nr:heavy metal translocating P-type ATPase metal-binding domain-containing protein [Candidatus Kapabacteria bacterium]MDW8220428.1 heavy metal translocating P-type ATPase metal-binding domain-containing protein [Bacteroidota bacterium]
MKILRRNSFSFLSNEQHSIASPKHEQQEAQRCYHCGEICVDTQIVMDNHVFCCEGCRFVYELLRDNHLCSYYDIDAHPGNSLRHVSTIQRRSRFDYLDDPDVRSALLQFASETVAKVCFRIPHIHCASCLWLLEKLYKFHDGICTSTVEFARKEVYITFNPRKISVRGIVELLTTLGYEPEIHLDVLHKQRHKTHQGTAQIIHGTRQASQKDAEATYRTSLYMKIGIAGFAFGNTMILSFPEYLSGTTTLDPQLRVLFGWLSIGISIPVLLYSASEYFVLSWQSLKHWHISLDVPIALGITVLFVRSVWEILIGATSGYLDSFSGLVFLLLCGKLFQHKTYDTLSFDRDYTSYFPIAISVIRDGMETTIPLSKLGVGDRILLRHNELVPADSVIESSEGYIDYSFVTGESAPVRVIQGDTVYAGGRVIGQALAMKTTATVSQSYLTSLWNNEAFRKHRKSALEEVSDRFGAYFTVFVVSLAAVAWVLWLPDTAKAAHAATAVLIIACPCAMTLAAPFALGWAVKILGNAGFYLKNTSVVVELTRVNTLVFDKTGTLTDTAKNRVQFVGSKLSAQEQEYLAAALCQSSHPLSRAIASTMKYATNLMLTVSSYEEAVSYGFTCSVEGHSVHIGSAEYVGTILYGKDRWAAVLNAEMFCRYVQRRNAILDARIIDYPLNAFTIPKQHPKIGAEVHVALDGVYKGFFVVQPQYRHGLAELFDALQRRFQLFIVSGDNDAERENLAALLGCTVVESMCRMVFYQTPHDKLERVRELQARGARVAMIGDGLNDAGALQQSDVGIALASEHAAFSPACDAVLSADKLYRLADYAKFAADTRRVIIGAFWISILYNAIGLTFAVMGWLSPLVSAILMPVSNTTVIGFASGATLLSAKLRQI